MEWRPGGHTITCMEWRPAVTRLHVWNGDQRSHDYMYGMETSGHGHLHLCGGSGEAVQSEWNIPYTPLVNAIF